MNSCEIRGYPQYYSVSVSSALFASEAKCPRNPEKRKLFTVERSALQSCFSGVCVEVKAAPVCGQFKVGNLQLEANRAIPGLHTTTPKYTLNEVLVGRLTHEDR